MDIVPTILEHTGGEPVALEQEDFGLGVLGHKVDTLFSLGHRDYVPATIDQKDFLPVNL